MAQGTGRHIFTGKCAGAYMSILFSLVSIASLVAGLVIIAVPRLLNFIVGVHLILVGVIGLIGAGSLRV